MGRRGYALESAAARVCREAGARVSTNVMRKMDSLPLDRPNTRRLEVVADGLPLAIKHHHGVSFAKESRPSTEEHDSGWGLVGDSQSAQGNTIPRVVWVSLEGPVLLSSLAKLEDGGLRKHGISCDTWPK